MNRLTSLDSQNSKLPPFAQAAGAVIDAAMQAATIASMRIEPNGDDFRIREQIVLRIAQASDKLVAMLIDDAHGNSTEKFQLCPTPMIDGLNNLDIFASFKAAADRADESHSEEAALADAGDRRFHER